MIITINNEFRCFKKGDSFDIHFASERNSDSQNTNRLLFLLGDNGTGKSTLMKALRKYKTVDFKHNFCEEVKKKETNLLLINEILDISHNVTVDGICENYDVIAAFDGEQDDGFHFGNAASATEFVDNGGYAKSQMSRGIRSAVSFCEWIKTLQPEVKNGRTLVLLDEPDSGWKMDYCLNLSAILNSNIKGCDIIIITHNILSMLSSKYYKNVSFYDIESREYTTLKDYFFEKTNMFINVSYSFDLEEENKKLREIIKNTKFEMTYDYILNKRSPIF